jgi:hypothetical protein
VSGFAELGGFSRHKPFECVGEVDESVAALAHLARDPAWCGDAVVKRLAFPASRQSDDAAWQRLFAERHPHRLPARYLAMLDACG